MESISKTANFNRVDFISNLRSWALLHNVSHISLRELLKLLQILNLSLPNDPRSVLHTPSNLQHGIIDVPPGKYWHFGLVRAINLVLEKTSDYPPELHIDISIDGIPISKSSKGQFWPILCSIHCFETQPLVIGVYYGMSKPSSVNSFLAKFLEEAEANQVIYKESRKIALKIRNFICDAPARSYLKGIKAHNGYFSCERCNEEGDYNNSTHQMCFPNVSRTIRTNATFREKCHEDHHTHQSSIEKLPIDMINNFPLDDMHLLCLGVMKKLLLIWIKNRSLKTKLSAKNIEEISSKLISTRVHTSIEFNRVARGLDVISYWKATELRTFLMYLGPMVLKDVVNQQGNQLLN